MDSATQARLAAEHARIDQTLDQQPDLRTLRREAEQLADRQQRAIRHVRALLKTVEEATQKLATVLTNSSKAIG